MSSQVQQAKEAFGGRLRELRKDAGLTGRQLSAATGLHFTKVSRLEHGGQNPSDADIRAWCQACDVEEQIPELVATLRGIEGMWLEWRRQLRGGWKWLQESARPLYEDAHLVRCYESVVVPGILQTAEYCAAVLRIAAEFYEIDHDIDAAIEARMERQRFLYHGDRRFAFVLEAWALQTIYGSREVMLAQLDRLLAVATLPRVSLGIIAPTAVRTMWPGEGFWIYDKRLVTVETTSAEMKVTQPREIALFARAFTGLQQLAVHGPDARQVIASAIDQLTQHPATS